MYYSSGNYEAFVRPLQARGCGAQIRLHRGYGTGGPVRRLLPGAGRTDARQAHPHFREGCPSQAVPATGWEYPGLGYVMRGGREMDNHFECHVGPVPLHPLH